MTAAELPAAQVAVATMVNPHVARAAGTQTQQGALRAAAAQAPPVRAHLERVFDEPAWLHQPERCSMETRLRDDMGARSRLQMARQQRRDFPAPHHDRCLVVDRVYPRNTAGAPVFGPA